jgi:hypothetical protein
VPQSPVTVPQGYTDAWFAIKTTPTSNTFVATITASANGSSESAKLTVSPPALSSISAYPSSVKGGDNLIVNVRLGSPAPTGGTSVSYSSDNSAIVVSGPIKVPAGSMSVAIAQQTKTVKSNTYVKLTATLNGQSESVYVTVTR